MLPMFAHGHLLRFGSLELRADWHDNFHRICEAQLRVTSTVSAEFPTPEVCLHGQFVGMIHHREPSILDGSIISCSEDEEDDVISCHCNMVAAGKDASQATGAWGGTLLREPLVPERFR
jgi:hypothetical protein